MLKPVDFNYFIVIFSHRPTLHYIPVKTFILTFYGLELQYLIAKLKA